MEQGSGFTSVGLEIFLKLEFGCSFQPRIGFQTRARVSNEGFKTLVRVSNNVSGLKLGFQSRVRVLKYGLKIVSN